MGGYSKTRILCVWCVALFGFTLILAFLLYRIDLHVSKINYNLSKAQVEQKGQC